MERYQKKHLKVTTTLEMIDNRERIALTIAGSDSSAGAGIQADLKSAAALHTYMASVITAITAQNTTGVSAIEAVSAKMVRAQIESVADDMRIEAVKTGMIPTIEIVGEVVDCIKRYNLKNIVIDPVMISTSGATLIPNSAATKIIDELFPISELITPNIIECRYITGVEINSAVDFDKAAAKFSSLGVKYLLLKGGHLLSDTIVDILYNLKTGSQTKFEFNHIITKNSHGTGCSLSSAVVSLMARGLTTEQSVGQAEIFIHDAILSGKDYLYGSGHGPINHFYKLWNQQNEK